VAYLIYQTFVMHANRMKQALERAEQERKHSEDTANLHLRTIRALALAIEAKDQTTGHHIHRVQTYAMELAKEFGLTGDDAEALRAAAILHDVGKLAVPESIISKPGKLTPEEFGKMKTHTVVGAEIVESVAFPFPVAPLVRAHHERWDGSGYPDGLRGEEIPLGARILSAVDFLDALTTDRQYRSALPLEKVMALIVSESGRSFDPRVVEVLSRRGVELERLARETTPADSIVLSTGAAVERGGAPDAGYAADSTGRAGHIAPDRFGQEAALLSALVGRIAGCTGSLAEDLGAVAEALRELIPFRTLALYERRGNLLECRLAVGEEAESFRGLHIESGVGVSGWTVVNRTPLVNGNPATEFGVSSKVPSGFSLLSAISVPLESEFGPFGALTLYNRAPNAFHFSHLRAMLAVSSSLAYRLHADSMLPGTAPAPEPSAEIADMGREIAVLGRSLLGETVPVSSPC
jgi:putative nucleotidyltransferase with HDIG domain